MATEIQILHNYIVTFIFSTILIILFESASANLSCYQCKRNSNTECSSIDLQPCSAVEDICVTIISKNARRGFFIKRECGRSPCKFDDNAVNKGLGLDYCDRTQKQYYCFFCCNDTGCNKNIANEVTMTYISFLMSCVLGILN